MTYDIMKIARYMFILKYFARNVHSTHILRNFDNLRKKHTMKNRTLSYIGILLNHERASQNSRWRIKLCRETVGK